MPLGMYVSVFTSLYFFKMKFFLFFLNVNTLFIFVAEWYYILGIPELFMEKTVVTHSSTLAWKILWTEEPHSLQFMGSQRVRHD